MIAHASPTSETASPQGEAAYRALLDDVRRGLLLPGARLRESEIAARLGISRTPVREAIHRLEADGLVVHQPRLGATVRRLDHGEVMELYEMRTVLEGTAARLAARAASEVELADLRAIHEDLAVTAEPALASRLNRHFHATLLNAAKNRFLVSAVATLERTLSILGRSTLVEPGRADAAVREHAAIMAALEARDGAAAEAAMRAHIEAAQRVRLRQQREAMADDAL